MEFSIYYLNKLDETTRIKFHQSLLTLLMKYKTEIESDEVLNKFVQYFNTDGQDSMVNEIFDNLYSAASAGVQVGSGNQTLYLEVLNAISESWKQIQ